MIGPLHCMLHEGRVTARKPCRILEHNSRSTGSAILAADKLRLHNPDSVLAWMARREGEAQIEAQPTYSQIVDPTELARSLKWKARGMTSRTKADLRAI